MATSFTVVPDRSTDLSATGSDQGITVSVTGQLQGMTWYLSEPASCTAGDKTRACTGGTVGPVTCAGTACPNVYKLAFNRARTRWGAGVAGDGQRDVRPTPPG